MKSQKLKLFLISFILSLPAWLAINMAEGSFESFWLNKEIANNPDIVKIQIAMPQKPELAPEISAKSAVVLLIKNNGEKSVIYSKNPDEKLPIASLTKIMSGYVAADYFDLNENITISESGLLERVSDKKFIPGQVFKAKDLLFASLVESQNDGMESIASIIGNEAFLSLMNLEAKSMGLNDTKFFNPTGLDPLNENEEINFSTASDFANLASIVFKNPEISQMLSKNEYDLYESNGNFHHKSSTTNSIIAESASFKGMDILAGKTGETEQAKGCLVLALKNNENIMIGVVLGSLDRFFEMKSILGWSIEKTNYQRIMEAL